MSDVPTTIVSSSRDGAMFSEESMKDLEDQLSSFTKEDFQEGAAPKAPAPEPEPPPEEPAVEEPPAEEPEAPPEDGEAPPEEEEDDPVALEAERYRIQMEQLQAKYDLQMAHNSRLAGQLGHLNEQLKSFASRPPSESYEPDTDSEARTSELERLQRLESKFVQAEVSQAIALGSTALDEPEARELREEIIAVAHNYKDELESVFAMTDSTVARQMSEALSRTILADAKEARWQARHASLQERKAATVRDSVLKKRAATVSGSGSVPPPPPKPKALSELSADEADAWLRQNVPPL